MPRASKATKGILGRTLMKVVDKKNLNYKPKTVDEPKFIHPENNQVIDSQQKDLQSCIDTDNLTDYLQVAQLSNKQYDALRGVKLNTNQNNKEVITDVNRDEQLIKEQMFNIQNNVYLHNLRIPRKPHWTKEMSKEELHQNENNSFVEWRKQLAKIEEANYTIQITPYEKNLEVWRQLWRVIERSDIVVQILDGRDPLFFRCPDLEVYSKEINAKKINFLLINKSDLLSEEIRQVWSDYFNNEGIAHMFFSAKNEQIRINDELANEQILQEEAQKGKSYLNTSQIASREILLASLKHLVEEIKESKFICGQNILENIEEDFQKANQNKHKNAIQIGMVGYPNVGKSSVINTLCNKKLVGVGTLPGKTKNFQTHFLEYDLILCDCPGLVFPNAASNRAEMVCNGVMPIDKMKDYLSPIDLMCQRIPKIVLEKVYKCKIEVEIPDAAYFLCAYATMKGYYNGSGQPDQSKSAKLILKDLVSGKLLFCKVPPGIEGNQGIWQSNAIELNMNNLLDENQLDVPKLENMEALQVNNEEIKLDEELLIEEMKKIGKNIMFDDNDLVELINGKKINGVKLNKMQKRDIKYMVQRGENIDFWKILQPSQIQEFGILNKAQLKNKK